MSEVSAQEPKSSGATPLVKLSRMLRNIVRRFPQARVEITRDGFGVSLDAQTYMRTSYSGHWTDADMRDCHALFATWYVADGAYLTSGGQRLAGVLQTVEMESARYSTQVERAGSH
jgi:hypothetical protein